MLPEDELDEDNVGKFIESNENDSNVVNNAAALQNNKNTSVTSN